MARDEGRDFAAVMEALTRVQAEGSPVLGSSGQYLERFALAAMRRIGSFAERGISGIDRERQVVDLAKGLVSKFEASPELVGPLAGDYEHAARQILSALTESTNAA